MAVTEVAAAVLAAAMEVDLDLVPRVHVVASAAADVATEEAAEAAKAAAVLIAALVAVAGALVAVAVSAHSFSMLPTLRWLGCADNARTLSYKHPASDCGT